MLIPYVPVPDEDITLPDRVFNPDYERAVLPRELHVPRKYYYFTSQKAAFLN